MKLLDRDMNPSRKRNNEPKEYLFVDGYNIINSWDILKDFEEGDIEESREKLIDILSEYQVYSGIEIILVFDAHLVKRNMGNKENRSGLKIVYTRENETADHYIERSLDKIGRIKRVRVATSDWMEQQIILGRGGTRISARELEIEIFSGRTKLTKKKKNKNEQNNILIGRLDEKSIEILNKLNVEE